MDSVLKLLIFGTTGLGIEVLFTAIASSSNKVKRDRVHLFGYSSLWYFPLYAVVLPLGIYFLNNPLHNLNWLFRGLCYALLIQTGEFLSMGLLRLINGESPSDAEYKKSGRSVLNLTRWDYFPAFIVLGLIFEYLVRQIILK